jgi:hypothetical protein
MHPLPSALLRVLHMRLHSNALLLLRMRLHRVPTVKVHVVRLAPPPCAPPLRTRRRGPPTHVPVVEVHATYAPTVKVHAVRPLLLHVLLHHRRGPPPMLFLFIYLCKWSVMSCSPISFSHFLISSSIVKFIFKFVCAILILVFLLKQISVTSFLSFKCDCKNNLISFYYWILENHNTENLLACCALTVQKFRCVRKILILKFARIIYAFVA